MGLVVSLRDKMSLLAVSDGDGQNTPAIAPSTKATPKARLASKDRNAP